MKELILGCGSARQKYINSPSSTSGEFESPVFLDFNSKHNPDVVWDLNILPWPFDDNSFTEIHAYNILEHLGQQGDFKTFFAHFDEMYRILRPDGYICGISVDFDSMHLWADPGHTRAITRQMLAAFLDREQYKLRETSSAITDYRFCYNGDFEYIGLNGDVIGDRETHQDSFAFILKAIKPARYPNN